MEWEGWKNRFSFGDGFSTDFKTVTINRSDTPPQL